MKAFRDPILVALVAGAVACALFVNPYYLYLLTIAALTVIGRRQVVSSQAW